MKRTLLVLLAFLFSATLAHGQATVFIGLSGTSGNSPSSGDLNAGTTKCDGGNFSIGSVPGWTYQSTPGAPAFNSPTTVCGNQVAGNASTSLSWLTGSSPANQNFQYHLTASGHVTWGHFFCANFNPMGASSFEYSLTGLEGGGGQTNLILTSLGIQLETTPGGGSGAGAVAYTGGTCSTDPTAWRWITVEYNTTSEVAKMWVYNSTITTLLGTFTANTPSYSATGAFVIGKTGAEDGPGGNRIYIRDFLINPTQSAGPLLPPTGGVSGGSVLPAPTSLGFGTIPQGSTSGGSLSVLSNTTGNTITVTGFPRTGQNPTDFNQTNTCGTTLNIGSSCIITVTFSPTATAGTSESATFNVTFSGGGVSPQPITVTGTSGSVGGGGSGLSAGLISTARSTDWTHAGVTGWGGNGAIPSASWTQCGATIAAYNGSATTITNAIAACGNNQFVKLGPGTFNLTGGIDFNHKAHVVLRGSGAKSTFLVPTAGATPVCGNIFICDKAADGTFYDPPPTNYTVSTNLAQGSTTLTPSSVTNIVANQTIGVLNQCEDGMSGNTNPCTGTSAANNNLFNASVIWANSSSGASLDGPDGGNGTATRFQMEMFSFPSISGGVLTLSHPLRSPNWSAARSPLLWFYQPLSFVGVEDFTVDMSNVPAGNGQTWSNGPAIHFSRGADDWVKGVKVVNAPLFGFWCVLCTRFQVEQNYFYGALAKVGAVSHAVNLTMVSDGLVQNNIFQQYDTPIHDEGSDDSTVFGYNALVDDISTQGGAVGSYDMDEAIRTHSDGVKYELFEGNYSPAIYWDDTHGTVLFETAFRNHLPGWESCGNGQCGSQPAKGFHANSFILSAFSRYEGAYGNVLGTLNFHTTYQLIGGGNKAIYLLGEGGGNAAVPTDPIVATTVSRYGNYDTVTGTVRWCGNASNTGWATTCGNTSEVGTGAPVYPGVVPTKGDTAAGQPSLPPSLYLTSKPSWFGSTPFPAIGPDVTGGNIGACPGVLNSSGTYAGVAATSSAQCGNGSLVSAWGGHVNAIPALQCFLSNGGKPDGTGAAITFDANDCYGGGVVGNGGVPTAPSNLKATSSQ
jgi:hypothetical protein